MNKQQIRQLLKQIESAQLRLYNKLVNLDIKSLNISEYNQRYLGNKIANLKPELQLYGRLLYLSLKNSLIPAGKFTLVDYGGGSGLISFLASEMGIGTVIYCDIYDVSCADVACLSSILKLPLGHIVCGDLDNLVTYLHQNKSIQLNAMVSYDVLEHIYDVEAHVKKLHSLSENKFRIVYGSGANSVNPRYLHSVKKTQIDAEYKNREKKWGDKDRDSLQSFFEVRKSMISKYAPELGFAQVDYLARSTRGLIQRDIEKCVDEFRVKGTISYHIDHPTNTCDPYTGNWSEHLMNFNWLEKIFKNEGFSIEICPGYYHTYGSFLKKSARVFLNAVIQLLGKRAMFIAPYFVIQSNSPEIVQCPRL